MSDAPISHPATPELDAIWQQRLQDLADHIAQDIALLKKYEDSVRYEDDPRRLARYHREIEQLRESSARYQQQYDDLRAQVTCELPTGMQDVGAQLQQMDAKLDALVARQVTILDDLSHLRQKLLDRYSASERVIIAAITERLAQPQLTTLQSILDVLEADRLSDAEMRDTLNAIHGTLTALQQQAGLLPGEQALAEVIKAPTLGIKHKLKVTIPIIPLLLGYEGELELGSEMNLEAAWRKLVARIQGG
jgi:hypothetical protein